MGGSNCCLCFVLDKAQIQLKSLKQEGVAKLVLLSCSEVLLSCSGERVGLHYRNSLWLIYQITLGSYYMKPLPFRPRPANLCI